MCQSVLYLSRCNSKTFQKGAAMSDEKRSSYRGLTEARRRANKKYNERFCEVKVRMTPKKRTIIQEHAASMGESATAFINRAIDEAMARDKQNKEE